MSENINKEKPEEYIKDIISSIIGFNEIKKAKSGQFFNCIRDKHKMCFVLIQGTCRILRTRDSLIYATIESPSIVGLSAFFNTSQTLVLQPRSGTEYIYMPLNDFLKNIDDNDLWRKLSFILLFTNFRYNDYLVRNNCVPTYKLICNNLLALDSEVFEIKATTSVVKYILDRTVLSRSCVMGVLSELRKGNYIVMHKGMLIKINKLPVRF